MPNFGLAERPNDFWCLSVVRKPFSRKEVQQSFSFSLAAMLPFFGQKQQRHHSFHYEIAVPPYETKGDLWLNTGLELISTQFFNVNIN